VTTSVRKRHLASVNQDLPVILCKPFSVAMLRNALLGKTDGSEQDYFEI
jgi:hypothetical protein